MSQEMVSKVKWGYIRFNLRVFFLGGGLQPTDPNLLLTSWHIQVFMDKSL